MNVRNALNHYRIWVVLTSPLATTLNASLSAQPRSFVWSHSINF